jgi:hypothetical protein
MDDIRSDRDLCSFDPDWLFRCDSLSCVAEKKAEGSGTKQ